MKLKDLGWRELHLGGGIMLTAIKGYQTPEVVAFIFRHPIDGSGPCEGLVPIVDKYARGEAPFEVRSWDPLTIEPSIRCTLHPEIHGQITRGLWVDQ